MWAQRYDKEMKHIFAVQDEIVQSLITTLNIQIELLRRGFDPVPQRTKSLEAYDYYLRGLAEWVAPNATPERLAQAQKMFEKAAELDPAYADAYAASGFLDFLAYLWQWDNGPYSLHRADELANKAIALNGSNSFAYAVRGWIGALRGHRNDAFADAEQAVSLDPNSAFAWLARADINVDLGGKPEDILLYIQEARRRDPRHPEIGLLDEGVAYIVMGRYSDGINALKRDEQIESHNPWVHACLIQEYSALGRQQEARAEAAELLRVSPGFSLAKVKQWHLGRQDSGAQQQFLKVLRDAGIK
jgi:adenylate cyclase